MLDEEPAWPLCGFKKLKKKMDVERLTPLIDQGFSRCTQRESVTNESNVKTKSDFFEDHTTETEAKSKKT